MIIGLLWIVGSYAVGIALVHWMHRKSQKRRVRFTHYVLMTRNNQLHMEWYLRSLYFFSSLKGREISVTIVDEGSSDDTLEIAERIGHEKDVPIRFESGEEAMETFVANHLDEEVVVVKLSGIDDARNISLLIQ
jgi:hypothetical protein